MPVLGAVLGSVASTVVGGALSKHKNSGTQQVATPYEDHKTSSENTDNTLKAWDKAQPLLSEILRGAGNAYSQNSGFINSQQAGLTPEMTKAIQQGSTSPWQEPAVQNALSGVQGAQAISAGAITDYAGKLGNSDLINNQMKELELNAKRRLSEDLIPSIRGQYDTQGMYNSGLARQAEERAVRDTSEGLSAQEAGLRANMYNTNMQAAGTALTGNRQFQSNAGGNLVDYGQAGFNNLKSAGNVAQKYAQQGVDINVANQQGAQQQPWNNLSNLYNFAAPLGQNFGTQSQTTNFNGDTHGVGTAPATYNNSPSLGNQAVAGALKGLTDPYTNKAGNETTGFNEMGTSLWNLMAGRG